MRVGRPNPGIPSHAQDHSRAWQRFPGQEAWKILVIRVFLKPDSAVASAAAHREVMADPACPTVLKNGPLSESVRELELHE